MFDRIRGAWEYTSQTWSEDPAARGAAKMGAGGLHITDAVLDIRGRIGRQVHWAAIGGGFWSDLSRLVWNSKRARHAGGGTLSTIEPASGPPSGWYDSPTDGPGTLRWWDGSAWTEHTETRQPPSSDG